MEARASVNRDLHGTPYIYFFGRDDKDHEVETVLKSGELVVRVKEGGEWVEIVPHYRMPPATKPGLGCAACEVKE